MQIRAFLCVVAILLILSELSVSNNILNNLSNTTFAGISVTPGVTSTPSFLKETATPNVNKPSNLVDVGSLVTQVLATIFGAILLSLAGWFTRNTWKSLISRAWSQKSPIKKRKKLRDLITYLQQEKLNILEAIAPGTTDLRMRDIIGDGELFISPPWRMLNGVSASTNLADYLIDTLDKDQRVLLLGEAGQGKTIILKHVFTILVDRFLANPRKGFRIPLYLPLREFSFSGHNEIEMLWSHLSRRFPLSFDDFEYLVRNNHITFLFDGFDENKGELTQHAINERAMSSIFSQQAILSCRKNFYDFYLSHSVIQELYQFKVELKLLTFTNPVRQYIAKFCDKKQSIGSNKTVTPATKIITAIQASPSLKDLAQRPLLLVMILDIFTDPGEVGENDWTMAIVYQKYTDKWLHNEAAKPNSILRADQKTMFMKDIAWSIYREREPVPYGLYQNITFTRNKLFSIIEKSPTSIVDKSIGIDRIIDDICFRSFLIPNEEASYSFIHKSFQEYYVAKYMYESMLYKEQSVDYVTKAFQELIPMDVSTFLQDMLMAKGLSSYEKERMVEILIEVYQQNNVSEERSMTVRQNTCYYLAVLGIKEAVFFLDHIYQKEENKRVKRAIAVGLAVYCDKMDLLEQYINALDTDPEAASINLGYYLVHYGDQALEEGYLDKGGKNCIGAVREIFYHLESDRFINLRLLELITLRMLLESRGLAILNTNEQYLPFLKEFLNKDFKWQKRLFQREKRRIEKILMSNNKANN